MCLTQRTMSTFFFSLRGHINSRPILENVNSSRKAWLHTASAWEVLVGSLWRAHTVPLSAGSPTGHLDFHSASNLPSGQQRADCLFPPALHQKDSSLLLLRGCHPPTLPGCKTPSVLNRAFHGLSLEMFTKGDRSEKISKCLFVYNSLFNSCLF